jgi:hypothetical protein
MTDKERIVRLIPAPRIDSVLQKGLDNMNSGGEIMTDIGIEMVVCPKAKECGDKCRFPTHNKNHEVNTWCRLFTNTGCPACIPVPSPTNHIGDTNKMVAKQGTLHGTLPPPEPVKPLGRDVYALFAEGKWQHFIKCSAPTSADNLVVQADVKPEKGLLLTKCEVAKIDKANMKLDDAYYLEWLKDEENHLDYRDWKLLKAQLLKCHQSEAAIEEQLTEIICSQYTRAEKAEARIKELEDKLHDQEDGFAMTCMNCQSEARADQNKKIGEWGNEPCPHRNND